MDKELPFAKAQSSEQMLIQLLFHFSVLMEYQLIDLQSNVRAFVEAMSEAIQKMDNLVVKEGETAQEIYESLFNKAQSEAMTLNQRANVRADDIFAEASGEEKNETENKPQVNSATGKMLMIKFGRKYQKELKVFLV